GSSLYHGAMEPSRLALALSPLAAVACTAGPRSPAPPISATAKMAAGTGSGKARASGTDPSGAASGAALSEGEPLLIQNVYGRKIRSLEGPWRAIVDPYENGYYDYRYEVQKDGYFINRKPSSKSDRIEYDFDRSEPLAVPGDWNSQRRELFLYEGTVWYKTD